MLKVPAAESVFLVLLFLSFTIAACNSGGGKSDGPLDLKTEMDKVSYSIGTQLGTSFKTNSMEIQTDILARAIEDVMNDRSLALTEDEMTEIMMKFNSDFQAKRQQEMSEAITKNLEIANSFLAENAKKEGITTLPNNIQYEVLKEGDGPKPELTSTVKVHYRGTLADGTEFDSSKPDQPAEFPLNGVIRGWTEILQLMNTGSKWKVFIPPDLGYREQGSPPRIPPNSLLIFEIELLEIVK
ncbi:FKBP-type peptidyl-prolyl cis-trans isomerase [Candidatus Latescibacterota bacterium]